MTEIGVDLAKLKRDWLHDSCWDIEDTPGYEAYREELLAFRLEEEAKRQARHEDYLRNERYRAQWFSGQDDPALWLNQQAREGFRLASMAASGDANQGCVFIIVERNLDGYDPTLIDWSRMAK